jgi:hypothetical protein
MGSSYHEGCVAVSFFKSYILWYAYSLCFYSLFWIITWIFVQEWREVVVFPVLYVAIHLLLAHLLRACCIVWKLRKIKCSASLGWYKRYARVGQVWMSRWIWFSMGASDLVCEPAFNRAVRFFRSPFSEFVLASSSTDRRVIQFFNVIIYDLFFYLFILFFCIYLYIYLNL